MTKAREAFRTISEVADWLQTPAHVLRFWESKFPQIKPVKRAGGRRYYRPEDMALLGGIKALLHDQGLTIKGVQKMLREQGPRHVMGLAPQALPDTGSLLAEDLPDDGAVAATTAVVPPPGPQPLTDRPGADVPMNVRPSQAAAEIAPTRAAAAFQPEVGTGAASLLAALASMPPRSLSHRAARIGPLLARLTAVRDRMART